LEDIIFAITSTPLDLLPFPELTRKSKGIHKDHGTKKKGMKGGNKLRMLNDKIAFPERKRVNPKTLSIEEFHTLPKETLSLVAEK